jgi:hypothetical protein
MATCKPGREAGEWTIGDATRAAWIKRDAALWERYQASGKSLAAFLRAHKAELTDYIRARLPDKREGGYYSGMR